MIDRVYGIVHGEVRIREIDARTTGRIRTGRDGLVTRDGGIDSNLVPFNDGVLGERGRGESEREKKKVGRVRCELHEVDCTVEAADDAWRKVREILDLRFWTGRRGPEMVKSYEA